jgi:hypothetical protein
VSLVSQLIASVPDGDKTLSSVLLQARVLADELGSDELAEWVRCELNGFPDGAELPDYRFVLAHYLGLFCGPFGAETRNVPLPIPAEYQDRLTRLGLYESVSSLESIVATGQDTVNFIPRASLEFFRQYTIHVNGQILNNVYGAYSTAQISQTLTSVRTRLLDFLLALRKKHPEVKTNDDALGDVPASEVKQLLITHVHSTGPVIIGDNSMGDIYHASGQVGAVGPNANVHGNTFQQIWSQSAESIDLQGLAPELRTLAEQLKPQVSAPEHRVAIANVEAAADAAASGDGPKALEYLKTAGAWTWTKANEIGVPVAIAAALKALGLA